MRLAVRRHGGEPIAVAVEAGPRWDQACPPPSAPWAWGRWTGRPRRPGDVVHAGRRGGRRGSGRLPDPMESSWRCRYLQQVPGVRGGVVVVGEHEIDVAGGVEIAQS